MNRCRGNSKRVGFFLTQVAQLALALIFLVFRTGYFMILRLAGRPVPWTFVAFMYHSIKPGETPYFSRQLDFLEKRTVIVAADFPETAAKPGKHYAALTFDDGYESFQRLAVPVLRKRRLPAAVFVATHYLGQSPAWATHSENSVPQERILDAAELKALLENGSVLVGSHSVSHVPIRSPRLDPDRIRFELEESRRELERQLGRAITLFAFPYGAYDQRSLRMAKEAGYRRVFLSEPMGTTTNLAGHVAGRLGTWPTEWMLSFRLKAIGAYQFLPLAIAVKARLRSWLGGSVAHEDALRMKG